MHNFDHNIDQKTIIITKTTTLTITYYIYIENVRHPTNGNK